MYYIYFSDSSSSIKPSKKDEKGSSSIESVEGLAVSDRLYKRP